MKNSSKIAIASPRGCHGSGYPNSLSEVIGELLKKIGKAFVGLADFFVFNLAVDRTQHAASLHDGVMGDVGECYSVIPKTCDWMIPSESTR